MPLCDGCILLRIHDIDDQDVLLKPNLLSLKTSAATGCEFCALCWRSLQSNTDPTQLSSLLRNEFIWPEGETWTPTIWLRGQNLPLGRRGEDKVIIWVSYGASELDESKRGPNYNPFAFVGATLEAYE
jgi:hypothetical protein